MIKKFGSCLFDSPFLFMCCMYVYGCMCVCLYVYVCVCMYVCMYVCGGGGGGGGVCMHDLHLKILQ